MGSAGASVLSSSSPYFFVPNLRVLRAARIETSANEYFCRDKFNEFTVVSRLRKQTCRWFKSQRFSVGMRKHVVR
jgi:hypothetical protein